MKTTWVQPSPKILHYSNCPSNCLNVQTQILWENRNLLASLCKTKQIAAKQVIQTCSKHFHYKVKEWQYKLAQSKTETSRKNTNSYSCLCDKKGPVVVGLLKRPPIYSWHCHMDTYWAGMHMPTDFRQLAVDCQRTIFISGTLTSWALYCYCTCFTN